MRFRTVALALALACGLTAPIEAKKKATTTKYSSKPRKVKRPKIQKYKPAKFKASKFKPAKVK